MNPNDFWILTCAEFSVICEGYNRKEINEINKVIMQAWYIEYMRITVENTKELSGLDEFLIDIDGKTKKHKTQTDEEMMQKARLLNAAMGGIEIIN